MAKWNSPSTWFGGKKQTLNKFNQAFFWGNNRTVDDDTDTKRYVDLAYNINPDVYSVINQISSKVISIPYCVKEIKDNVSYVKLKRLQKASNYNMTTAQKVNALRLEMKSVSEDEYGLPLVVPNATQNWDEFWKLSETFLNLTGNVYWYKLSPEDGMNKGVPIQIYVLPSHLMDIVLRQDANVLSVENPIDHYLLTEYANYIEFKKENVIHISVGNPNFGFSGEHLYGQSPLRAAWKNIEASNKGLDLNVNTLKNGGVFGFIHAKGTPLTMDQAVELKSRLKEMNNSAEDLSRIAGISSELGFTRLSLSADELKPFEYLNYNQKQICNVLGWSDTFLNNDNGGKYDKQLEEKKRVLTNKVIPDIKMMVEPFNKEFLQLFKGYENKELVFEFNDLPELQDDLDTLINWITKAVDTGLMSRNEGRAAMRMMSVEDDNMDTYTVKDDVMTLQDAILPQDNLTM